MNGVVRKTQTTKAADTSGQRSVNADNAKSLLGVAMAIRGLNMERAATLCGIAKSSLEILNEGHTFMLSDLGKKRVQAVFGYSAAELSRKNTPDAKLAIMMNAPLDKHE